MAMCKAAILYSHPWMLAFSVFFTLSHFICRQSVNAFTLDGSPSCYARFPKWYHAFENTLSFEFVTGRLDGLLLYTDDGGGSNFFEISLVSGRLQLLFNLGKQPTTSKPSELHSVQVATVDSPPLNDHKWHRVNLFQFWERVQLQLDEQSVYKSVEHNEFVFGNYDLNSDVFIGGTPNTVLPDALSYPAAKLMVHFEGSVRNLIYRTLPNGMTVPAMIESVGLRQTDIDYCVEHICLNHGMCYSTDDGARCNCEETDFEGERCESERSVSEATFLGFEYLGFNLSWNGNNLVTKEESLTLQFKTSAPNGVLFYAGNMKDFIVVALQDGAVTVHSNTGGTLQDAKVVPFSLNHSTQRQRFNDNLWHSLMLNRKLDKLTLDVDNVRSDVRQAIRFKEHFVVQFAYIGGKKSKTYGSKRIQNSKFVGCMRKVVYRTEGRYLDFLESAKHANGVVKIHGNINFTCREPLSSEPISFFTSNSYLTSPSLHSPLSGSLSFQFRTNQPDGFILYNAANDSRTDFFAVELINGRLFFTISLGTGTLRLQVSSKPMNDAQWHSISIIREARNGRVNVDNFFIDFATPGRGKYLNTGNTIFIAGYPWDQLDLKAQPPPSVWTATLRKGFIGCLRDLTQNGIYVDLIGLLKENKTDGVEVGCYDTLPQCNELACQNGGVCLEQWNRFYCDCTPTFYTGTRCEKEMSVVAFQKGSYAQINLPIVWRSEAEDFRLKFRSTHPDGLILGLACKSNPNVIVWRFRDGFLEFFINYHDGLHAFKWSNRLNDSQWHWFVFKRRSQKVELTLDGKQLPNKEIRSVSHVILEYDAFMIGGVHGNRALQHLVGPSFHGDMADFVFNGVDMLQLAVVNQLTAYDLKPGVNISALFNVRFLSDDVDVFTVEQDGYAVLDWFPKNINHFHISFSFCTLAKEAVLLFSMTKSGSYVLLEIVNGRLRYSVDSGEGTKVFYSNDKMLVNDLKWHSVSLRNEEAADGPFVVDGKKNSTLWIQPWTSNVRHTRLDKPVYIGGLDSKSLATHADILSARKGFLGCLASVKMNGLSKSLIKDSISHYGIKSGCEGPTESCRPDICANGGVCIQHWKNFSCDCTLTTYEGPTCSEHGVSLMFGPRPGVVIIEIDDMDVTSDDFDLVSVGVVTELHDSVIAQFDGRLARHMIMVTVQRGFCVIFYTSGYSTIQFGDHQHRIDDGRYHTILLNVSEPQIKLRVDQNSPVSQDLSASAVSKWGDLRLVQSSRSITIGGRLTNTLSKRDTDDAMIRRLKDPLIGVLSGFTINRNWLFHLVLKNDSRVIVSGDVKRYSFPVESDGPPVPGAVGRPPSTAIAVNRTQDEQQQRRTKEMRDKMLASSSVPQNTADELLVSGEPTAGSGCSDNVDDEDCVSFIPNTSDLITPYVVKETSTKVTEAPLSIEETTSGAAVPSSSPSTPLSTANAVAAHVNTSFPSPRVHPIPAALTVADCDSSIARNCEHLPAVTTVTPAATRATQRTVRIEWTTEKARPPVFSGGHRSPSHTSSPTIMSEGNQYNSEEMLYPDFDVPESQTTTPNASDAVTVLIVGPSFPKTDVIASVSVSLIVVMILIVFSVFKCRKESESSCSSIDSKTINPANTDPNEDVEAMEDTIIGNQHLLSNPAYGMKAHRKGGKSKAVKEWYV